MDGAAVRRAPAGGVVGHGLGLDIGHSAVSLVEVHSSRLLRWSTTPLAAGAMASGAVRDVAAVADGVRRVLSGAAAAGRLVASGIPGAACFIRRMQFPDLPPKDLQRAVRWEAERLLPYPFEEAAIDYDILVRREEQGKTLVDVVLVGARAEVVDGFRAAVESGGAKLSALDAIPLARLRAYHREAQSPGALFVHLGSQWTELTAADEYGLVFTRAVAAGVPFDSAQGPTPEADRIPPRPVRGASGARTLLEEVIRSVRFFETQAGRQVARIILTGPGAEDPRTAAMFAGSDLPPVAVVDPLAGLEHDAAVPVPGLRLAAAAGLAMRAERVPVTKESPWR